MREWLKEKRQEQGLTGREMAERLGITEPYYWLIESGQRKQKMDVGLVVELARILHMSIDNIIGYETR